MKVVSLAGGPAFHRAEETVADIGGQPKHDLEPSASWHHDHRQAPERLLTIGIASADADAACLQPRCLLGSTGDRGATTMRVNDGRDVHRDDQSAAAIEVEISDPQARATMPDHAVEGATWCAYGKVYPEANVPNSGGCLSGRIIVCGDTAACLSLTGMKVRRKFYTILAKVFLLCSSLTRHFPYHRSLCRQ